MDKVLTAVYGGTFNPIHVGHVAIGEQLLLRTAVAEVWYMVSPLNPFKQGQQLAPDEVRFELAKKALKGHKGLKASDYEFQLTKPSYTWNTLQKLRAEYPEREFALVIGADNWPRFGDWYHSADILSTTQIFIFPRQGTDIDTASLPENVQFVEMPLVNVSSTEIREKASKGESIRGLVPANIERKVQKLFNLRFENGLRRPFSRSAK